MQENKILKCQKQEAAENQRGKPSHWHHFARHGGKRGTLLFWGYPKGVDFLPVLELEFRPLT